MNGFPEAQPEIQKSQSAGDPAHKTVGNNLAQFRRPEQQGIIRPAGSPGENDQQNSKGRTKSYEKQRACTPKPNLPSANRGSSRRRGRRRLFLNQRNWIMIGCRIGPQSVLPSSRRHSWPTEMTAIQIFYVLSALIRSETSRYSILLP